MEEVRRRANQPRKVLSKTALPGLAGPSKSGTPMMEKGDLENAIKQLKQGTNWRKTRRTAETTSQDDTDSPDSRISRSPARKESDGTPKPSDLLLATEAIIRLQQQRTNMESDG